MHNAVCVSSSLSPLQDKACKEFEPEFKIEIFLDRVEEDVGEVRGRRISSVILRGYMLTLGPIRTQSPSFLHSVSSLPFPLFFSVASVSALQFDANNSKKQLAYLDADNDEDMADDDD